MISKGILAKLAGIVGARHATTEPVELAAYAYDGTHFTSHPDVVLRPANASEIAAILRVANAEGIPVVPRGSGTSLSGGSTPIHGGIVLHMARLNRILDVDVPNCTATAEPGVITADLQREVEKRGLFYPPDPSSLSVATLGGNLGHGAGGPRGLKYGTTKDYVVGVEAVLANGRLIRTGGVTPTDDAGYDLTHLFVGSEGTLGVITKLTVRLLPLPEAKQTALAIFDSFDTAAEAVARIIAAKIVPTTLELIDNFTIRRVQEFRPLGLPEDAEGFLLMEVDGLAVEVTTQIEVVADIARRCGAREVKIARSKEENEYLWAARRTAYAALAKWRPTNLTEDATVPRDRVPELMRKMTELARKFELEVTVVGHAGDGNTHPVVLFDSRNKDEVARAERFTDELFEAAVAMGGTLSGEHGIGLVKAKYMPWQHGAAGIAAMRLVKRVFDPNGILNPGKVLPE
ncbi:MAG: FAD-binding oxidoreductase [Chloroflexota bacterium]